MNKNYEQKLKTIKAQKKLLDVVANFRARFDKLASRENEPLSISKFCAKHGFHKAQISRSMNMETFPREETIKKIDKALKKEKV